MCVGKFCSIRILQRFFTVRTCLHEVLLILRSTCMLVWHAFFELRKFLFSSHFLFARQVTSRLSLPYESCDFSMARCHIIRARNITYWMPIKNGTKQSNCHLLFLRFHLSAIADAMVWCLTPPRLISQARIHATCSECFCVKWNTYLHLHCIQPQMTR